MRWLACTVLAVLAGCSGEGTLVLAVRTDLVPAREFAAVTAVITPGDGSEERTFTVDAEDARDWGAGVRIAEAALPAGRHAARVRALDADGAPIVERSVRFEVTGGVRAVTVWLTRDCLGVVCPLAGDAPSLVACLAGRCVEDGCAEESPDACGPPACASASDCGPAPAGACAARECTASGACVDALDHAACGADEVCDANAGCAPVARPPLSPPGAGHVHLVALTPGYHVYRLELREGAPTEDVSAQLEARLPSVSGHADDTSAGLSADGEWLSMVVRRGACIGCLLVAPVRDLSAAELLADVAAAPYGGTAITNGGATVVYQGAAGGLFAVRRGPGGWTPDPVALTASSPFRDHRDPSLTPDGARVVFECNDGDRTAAGLCEVGLDGSGFAVRLPLDVVELGSPGLPRETDDGGLLFHARWGGVPGLYRLPPGSTTPEPAFPGGDSGWEYPCVLPDGRVVVPFEGAVHVLGADGRPARSVDVALPPERTSFYLDACGL